MVGDAEWSISRSTSETPSIKSIIQVSFQVVTNETVVCPNGLAALTVCISLTSPMGSPDELHVPPPPPRWVLDLNDPPISKGKLVGVADPPGFSSGGGNFSKVRWEGIIFTACPSYKSQKGALASKQAEAPPLRLASDDDMDTLKLKKAWELAIGPAKALPMSAIGMWMTGNSLQIFSVFMLYSLLKNPFTAIANTNATFSRLESEKIKSKLLLVKLVFIMTNLLSVALGIYKIDKMGLLP